MNYTKLSKKEFETRLYKQFGKYLELDKYGVETKPGWYNLIWKLTEDITDHLDDTDGVLHIVQIKQKFGGLRYYIRGGDDIVYDLINIAETHSFNICEICGENGQLNNEHLFVQTLCPKHVKERDNRLTKKQKEILRKKIKAGNYIPPSISP